MTLNKVKFIEAKAAGANNTQAALAAGSTPKGARRSGTRLSKDQKVQKAFQAALKRSGVKMDDLLDVYVGALKAEKTIVDKLTGEVWKDPDYATRMKAADKFMNLLGVNKASALEAPDIMSNAMKKALDNGDDVALLALMKGRNTE